MEKYLAYWQACSQQEILHAITLKQLQPHVVNISNEECVSGRLRNAEFIKKYANTLLGIIPSYVTYEQEIFFPYILLVELDNDGSFKPQVHLAYPIIPQQVLEPSTTQPIVLGMREQFADYIAVNPPSWHDGVLSWQLQQEYAKQMLDAVNEHWLDDLIALNYKVQTGAMAFAVTDLMHLCNIQLQEDVNLSIFKRKKNIKIIDAPANSNKEQYIKDLVLHGWVHAAISKIDPPKFVVVEPNKPITYTTMFDYVDAKQSAEDVYPNLVIKFNIYTQGMHVYKNWNDMRKRIIEKYQDKGGLQERRVQLQNNVKQATANHRHLSVLASIWSRQHELLSKWTKMFDFIPVLQKNRLARLYTFCAQNFPDEEVAGFTQAQFEELLQQKQTRAENSLRMLNDCLHQVETDQHQLEIVREKCLQWASDQGIELSAISDVDEFLKATIWPQVIDLAANYWQQDFLAKKGYNNFCSKYPTQIDQLIINDAQYISLILAVILGANTKNLTVFGNYNALDFERYPVYIDYELAKHCGLVKDDMDFEDLQFAGILGSVGNLWNLVTTDREADEILEDDEIDIEYEFINDASISCVQNGSKVNVGVTEKLLVWLQQNQSNYRDINIYTPFSEQAKSVIKMLAKHNLQNIPVRLLQERCGQKAKVNIFLPVYSEQDPPPYVFDKGSAMFDQLVQNTGEKLIVIGSQAIFKPKLHSASGNFAKLFNFEIVNNNIKNKEVICE